MKPGHPFKWIRGKHWKKTMAAPFLFFAPPRRRGTEMASFPSNPSRFHTVSQLHVGKSCRVGEPDSLQRLTFSVK